MEVNGMNQIQMQQSGSNWINVDQIGLDMIQFDPNEGKRFLQGCYIDYDSTEGKLKHLKRKLNL